MAMLVITTDGTVVDCMNHCSAGSMFAAVFSANIFVAESPEIMEVVGFSCPNSSDYFKGFHAKEDWLLIAAQEHIHVFVW